MIQFRPYIEKEKDAAKSKNGSLLAILDTLGIAPDSLGIAPDSLGIAPINNAPFSTEESRYFVVDDGNEIVGICAYRFLTDDLAHIHNIFIKPSERNMKLGDGLFRSVLNSIEIKGGSRVVCSGTQNEIDFYIHEGMQVVADCAKVLGQAASSSGYEPCVYLESIGKFFSKPCKGSSEK